MLLKSLVKQILLFPDGRDWSLQGLGMLRLYIDDEHRMHIWDDRYQVENVSQIHTHPWNFESTVVAGIVRNQISVEVEGEPTHYRQSIFCGVGGGLEGTPEKTRLTESSYKTYREGDTYKELAHQIHVSSPERGTITIIKREYLDDADHALVFWENGEWVSAEPRQATPYEVNDIVINSLRTWFSD